MIDSHFSFRQLLRGPLGLVLLIAFLARLASVIARPDLITVDTDGYLDIARHLTRGLGFSAGEPPYLTGFRPPLYPVFITLSLLITGSLTALAYAQILLSTLTVLLTYQLALRLNLSRAAALVAAAFIALDPVLIHVTATAMTETLSTFLIALWALQITRTDSSNDRTDLLTGLWLGLSCLCRPTFLPMLGFLILFLLIKIFIPTRPSNSSIPLHLSPRSIAIQLICAVLVILPWSIRNGLYLGKWTPATTHGGYTLLLGNNPTFYREVIRGPWNRAWEGQSLNVWQQDLERRIAAVTPRIIEERDRDAWFYRDAWTSIQKEPGMFIQSAFYRLYRLWDILPQHPIRDQLPPVIVALIAGFFSLEWLLACVGFLAILRHRLSLWTPLLALIACVCFVHLFYWTDLRMRTPLIPIIAPLAALGWNSLMAPRSASKLPSQKQ